MIDHGARCPSATVRADPVRIKRYIEKLLKNWPQSFPKAPAMKQAAAGDVAAAPPAAHASGGQGRLPLLTTGIAQGEAARYLAAAEKMPGGLTNAMRTWAHDPYQSKLFLPLQMVLEREGAGSILPTPLKLLVSIRIGHLNKAAYSLAHRTAMAHAMGMSSAQLAALAGTDWKTAGQFAPLEAAAITWAESVTDNTAKLRNDLFDALKSHFSEAGIVELTGLCAFSNRMDLLHNALRIPLESEREIAAINRTARLEPAQLKAYIETLLVNWPDEFPLPSANGQPRLAT